MIIRYNPNINKFKPNLATHNKYHSHPNYNTLILISKSIYRKFTNHNNNKWHSLILIKFRSL